MLLDHLELRSGYLQIQGRLIGNHWLVSAQRCPLGPVSSLSKSYKLPLVLRPAALQRAALCQLGGTQAPMMGMSRPVFLSYASQDAEAARDNCDVLRADLSVRQDCEREDRSTADE